MHTHMILVTFHGPTKFRSARVKLTSQRFEKDAVALEFDHKYSNTFNQAADWLHNQGFTTVASGDAPNGYLFAVREFCALKDAHKDTGAVAAWRTRHT